ncbi:pyridoxal-dependent decarboxylase [Thermogladius sp. 4427co]|uniref:pyridoxal-dependent decarboxylase n=1 Tax=Thermogladius sp. 4427co TaxID=3450718 RepID=UPI003F7ACE5D
MDYSSIVPVLRVLNRLYNNTPRHGESILGSMTTQPLPIALYAFTLFSHTNLADIELFPPLKEMEVEVLEYMKRLYGSGVGYVTAGATESNIIALYTARTLRGGRSNYVIAPDTVHVSVDKACIILGCRLLKIETRARPVDPGRVEDYVKKYDPFAIVITAGTTELGLVDPIREVGRIADEYNVFLHVDAAYGGLIIPFLYEKGLIAENTYFYKGVSSLAVDFHKFGSVPAPAGIILFSSRELMEASCFDNPYTLSGRNCGLLGTRNGGSLAGIWAVFKSLGLDYFREKALWAFNLATMIYERVNSIEGFEALKPATTILAFKHRLLPPEYILARLAERRLYLYKAPSVNGVRVVVMPHFSERLVDKLVSSLREISGVKIG